MRLSFEGQVPKKRILNEPEESKGDRGGEEYVGSISEERESCVAQAVEDERAHLEESNLSSDEKDKVLDFAEKAARERFDFEKVKDLARFTDDDIRILKTARDNPDDYVKILSAKELGKLNDLLEREKKAQILLLEEAGQSARKMDA